MNLLFRDKPFMKFIIFRLFEKSWLENSACLRCRGSRGTEFQVPVREKRMAECLLLKTV